MRLAFLKKGGNRWESNDSTVARLDELKIVRSACFLLTPVHVDRPPGARPRSSCARRSDLRDETRTGTAYGGTSFGCRPSCGLGRRGYGLRERPAIAGCAGSSQTGICLGRDL